MSHYIEWLDSYSVGVAQFDEDHKVLISLADRIVSALYEHDTRDVIEEILDKLIEYVVYHFDNEERLMEETDYPDFRRHKDVHNELIRQVLRFRYNNHRHTLKPVDVAEFLIDWVVTHIKVDDMRYAEHFNRLGIS